MSQIPSDVSSIYIQKSDDNPQSITLFAACENGNVLMYSCDTVSQICTLIKTFAHSDIPPSERMILQYNPIMGNKVTQMHATEDYLFTLQNSFVFQWKISDGTFVRNVTKGKQKCLCFSILGPSIFTSHTDQYVYTWSIETNTCILPQYFSDGPVYSIVFYKWNSLVYATKTHVKRMFITNQLTVHLLSTGNTFAPSPSCLHIDCNDLYYVSPKRIFLCTLSTKSNSTFENVVIGESLHFSTFDGFFFLHAFGNNISVFSKNNDTVQYIAVDEPIKCMAAYNYSLFIVTNSEIIIKSFKLPEEDSFSFINWCANSGSLVGPRNVSHCANLNLSELQPFTPTDNPIMIYTTNSQEQFTKAACFTRSDLISFYASDSSTDDTPTTLMSIYTRPNTFGQTTETNGFGTKPTGRIVAKLPVNNLYVTFGSMQRVLRNENQLTWYALPLFGGKRRRIGNVSGIFGMSMNHGQIPGAKIYKLFTYNELNSIAGVRCEESPNDWPSFIHSAALPICSTLNVDSFYITALFHELLYDV